MSQQQRVVSLLREDCPLLSSQPAETSGPSTSNAAAAAPTTSFREKCLKCGEEVPVINMDIHHEVCGSSEPDNELLMSMTPPTKQKRTTSTITRPICYFACILTTVIMWTFTVVLMLTSSSAPLVIGQSANKSYSLTLGDGFNVSITPPQGGAATMVLQHSKQSPMLFVGIDHLNIGEFRGNFRIQDYVTERIGLTDFTVTTTTTTDTITMTFGKISVNVTLSSRVSHPLVVTITGVNPGYGTIWLRMMATPDERVYGLGEQYSYLNLRDRSYPIWTREQGVGRNKSGIVTFLADNYGGGAGGDYHTTYFPQPTYVSSRNYYCHYTGSNYAVFNFQPKTFHEVYVVGAVQEFYFYADTDIKSVTTHLSGYLGRQPELPDWVYTGAILGVQGGTTTMLQRYNQSVAAGVPVNGLWIQDWSGGITTSFGYRVYWDWKWNTTHYPDLKATITRLKTAGVRVFAYINPNLVQGGDLFKEAASKGYLIKQAYGNDPYITDFGEFNCGTVDLTNQNGFNWYKGKIQTNMIDLGLGGWMADFGEYLPVTGAKFANGKSGRDLHNEWPVLWARCNREAIDERKATGDVVFWMRAGAAGTGKYTTLMWAGDQNVDFSYGDGLPSTIPAALNMGMSGIGITHIDIGGYTTAAQYKALGQSLVRTEELFLRSAESAIFSPLFRTHEGNQPKANVQFYSSANIEAQFARLAQIFVHISNYTKHLVQQNALFGVPVQRPMFMEFPADTNAWTMSYQFMFGPDVIVAPVIQSKVTRMKVYIPSGTWKYIWDDTPIVSSGTFVHVDAPLGKPPAFYNVNSTFMSIFSQIKSKFPVIPNPSTSTTMPPVTNTTVPYTGAGSIMLPSAVTWLLAAMASILTSLRVCSS